MKAIAIASHGGPETLQRRGLPRPQPHGDELLIRVVAAGVTQLDATASRGELAPQIAGSFPWVPGFEAAGVVEALGPEVQTFRPGDRVWAVLRSGGAYGQFATAAESWVAPMPPSLLFEEAAALALDGLAGWTALFGSDRPVDGSSTVLVLGASSGAGHLATQLALGSGARVLVAAAPEHRAFVDELGSVEWIGSGEDRLAKLPIWGPRDRAIDATSPGDSVNDSNSDRAANWVDLGGGPASIQAMMVRERLPADGLASLTRRVLQRRLRPRLSKILKIEQAVEAQETLNAADSWGKIAMTF